MRRALPASLLWLALAALPGCGLLWGTPLSGDGADGGSGLDGGPIARLDASPDASTDASPDASTDAGSGEPDAGPIVIPRECMGEGLIACYPFDVDARDYSGNGHHARATGIRYGPDRSGAGAALHRDARSEVFVPHHSDLELSTFTFELWVFVQGPPAPGEKSYFFQKEGLTGAWIDSEYRLHVQNGGLGTRTSPLTPGNWHHLALVRDTTRNNRAYLDGELLFNGSGGALPASTAPLGVGEAGVASGGDLVGILDDLRIWGRALSHEEICDIAGRLACPTPAP